MSFSVRELTIAYGRARQLCKMSAFLWQSVVTHSIDSDKDILASVTEFTALGWVSTSTVKVNWAESLERP